jgi:RecB family exonuclease
VQELDPKLMAIAQRLQSYSIAGRNTAQKGLLIAFLEHEIARNWRGQSLSRTGEPTLLEWRFGFEDPGTGEEGPIEVVATDGRRAFAIKLRGIVDRVDVLPGAAPTFWVIDYKTGGACPTKTQLNEGGVVQLPLYALATCSARPGFGECAGLAYYHLTRSEMKLVSVPGSRNQTSAVEIIEKAMSRLARQMELISQGHFLPLGTQRQKSKSYCEEKCPFYLVSCFGVADPLLVNKIDRLSSTKKENEASCANDG